MRSSQLALVLRSLRERGPRSRARLAADLGLTRSAISTIVAELDSLGLVRERGVERGGLGRPGTTVELAGGNVCGIGAEIGVQHLAVMAVDLADAVVVEHRVSLDVAQLGVDEVLDRVVDLLATATAHVRRAGSTPVGVGIGVAGLLDSQREVLVLGPNLRWRDVELGTRLRPRIADRLDVDLPVTLDNEGNLAAIAEARSADPARQDMLVVLGAVGVGGGVVADGRLVRGRQGYAGELGHVLVQPGGRRCGCGRVGCWETLVGLRALLDEATDRDDPVRDPARTPEELVAELDRRAVLGDRRTLDALDHLGGWLGRGIAVLASALNPGVVVLGGYFAGLGRHLRPALEEHLGAGVLAPHAGGTVVELSDLGFTGAVRGGAAVALEAVLDDPSLIGRTDALVGGAR